VPERLKNRDKQTAIIDREFETGWGASVLAAEQIMIAEYKIPPLAAMVHVRRLTNARLPTAMDYRESVICLPSLCCQLRDDGAPR